MLAPIVTPSVTTRSVYFPSNFFEYHKGKFMKGSENATITNAITDPVPMFIREGYGVFTQNTSNITRSSQLLSNFEFRAGSMLVEETEDVEIYEAKGEVLSIQDYNDESKVSRCINEGCVYKTVWRMEKHKKGDHKLTVESTYEGSLGLN